MGSFVFKSLYCLSLILATMEVYKDFFLYGDGVYSKTDFAGSKPLGFHSVKIVGWGEENKNPYWVKMNLHI